FEEGLSWARRAGADATEGRILGGLASVAGAMGDSADTVEYARLWIEASRRAGDKQRLGLLYNMLAWNAWDDGDGSAALRYWADAVQFMCAWEARAFLRSI